MTLAAEELLCPFHTDFGGPEDEKLPVGSRVTALAGLSMDGS